MRVHVIRRWKLCPAPLAWMLEEIMRMTVEFVTMSKRSILSMMGVTIVSFSYQNVIMKVISTL